MWLGIPIFFYTKQFWQGESLQLNPGRSFSDDFGAFATIDRLHRTTASPLEFRGSSKRSTHIELELKLEKRIHWPRSWQ